MDVVALEKTEEYQGRYRVEHTLGAGGMGVVYLAEDIKLRRKVAIKRLRSDLSGNSAEARFRSEAELLARLNHPNIVRLYDVLEENNGIALVMELVEGVTLKEWLRENSPTLAIKLDLLMQICQGLSKAHSLGIIHRDLKLENILVTNDGVAKITDFGIAKALDCDQQLTREDHIAGSIQAMSPEQVQGAPLDARSDLFSLGSITYELFCGSKPFERGDLNALAFAQQICNAPHVSPQSHWPEIPKPLIALLDRLLSKRPELRPDSAQQVYEALSLVRHHGIDASTQQYSETVTQLLLKPRKKRNRLTAVLVGLIALGAVGIWGWQTYTKLPPQYIAVLPIELHGELSGGNEANQLAKTMVRQALISAPDRLKSSALVSFEPGKDSSLEDQLLQLRNKGVSDALFARLDCMQVRCNIEIQRINPSDSQIKEQSGFAFLADHRQEAQYTIRNSVVELFPHQYHEALNKDVKMSRDDYNLYLAINAKLSNRGAINSTDLETLKELIGKYPQNTNLYLSYSKTALKLWAVKNDSKILTSALGIISSAEGTTSNNTAILEAKLLLKSAGSDKKGFEAVLKALQSRGYPSAHLLAQYSRFKYIQGDYQAGLTYANQAAALAPSAHNQYLIAINQLQTGNYEATRTTLSKLLENYPEYWSAYSVLGVIELETGDLEAAKKAITKIPEQFRSLRTETNLGVVYFLQGDHRKALSIYKKVNELSPFNLAAIYHLAEVYQVLGNKSDAKSLYQKIIELTEKINPEENTQKQTRFRAIALASLNREPEAIALLHQLLKTNPDDTDVKFSAALIYALSGEWRSANFYIEELINQQMGAEWFSLPAFQQLCSQHQASQVTLDTICRS